MAKTPALRKQPKGVSKDAGSRNFRKKRARARGMPPVYGDGKRKGMGTS